MIELKSKSDCCGCSACVQRCPKQCISMQEDEEGFLYPQIDLTQCINCGLCEKVCPVINQNEQREPLAVYAAKNQSDNVRLQSSSGGIFTLLAESIIAKGGVVFGARWNKPSWNVVHDFTETVEGLSDFRSSKYLQSVIGNSYKEAELFLKQGREVLFTGTPCQISGLKHYLRKEYPNLWTCEIFCHSVPSPKIWQVYLDECLQCLNWRREDIKTINFRDKCQGWKNYHFTMQSSQDEQFDTVSSEHPYMKGFLAGLYTRPSCHACPAKQLKSGSDFTIGDYWGIQHLNPLVDDDKGISAVLVNTEKSQKLWEQLNPTQCAMDYALLCHYNPALVRSSLVNKLQKRFWTSQTNFTQTIEVLFHRTLYRKVINRLKFIFLRCLNFLR